MLDGVHGHPQCLPLVDHPSLVLHPVGGSNLVHGGVVVHRDLPQAVAGLNQVLDVLLAAPRRHRRDPGPAVHATMLVWRRKSLPPAGEDARSRGAERPRAKRARRDHPSERGGRDGDHRDGSPGRRSVPPVCAIAFKYIRVTVRFRWQWFGDAKTGRRARCRTPGSHSSRRGDRRGRRDVAHPPGFLTHRIALHGVRDVRPRGAVRSHVRGGRRGQGWRRGLQVAASQDERLPRAGILHSRVERARGVHRQPQRLSRAGHLRRHRAQVPHGRVLRPRVRVEPRAPVAPELRRRRELGADRGGGAANRPARAGPLAQGAQLRAEQSRVRADHRLAERRRKVRAKVRRLRDPRVYEDDVRG